MHKYPILFLLISSFIRPTAACCGTNVVKRGGMDFSACIADSVINPADSIVFLDMEIIDFGSMQQGEVLSVQFSFMNAGSDSLEIDIISACDCMDVKWMETPIAPGERGTVDVLFDTTNNPGEQKKDIDIIFKNTDKRGYPLVRRAVLKGNVSPK
jgi:hypothetical protein